MLSDNPKFELVATTADATEFRARFKFVFYINRRGALTVKSQSRNLTDGTDGYRRVQYCIEEFQSMALVLVESDLQYATVPVHRGYVDQDDIDTWEQENSGKLKVDAYMFVVVGWINILGIAWLLNRKAHFRRAGGGQ
ncbi:hypothetical protein B0H12DRAFT_1076743 [Mycena haematopus]|nr:hypothetical protein B0H12DRAFT_1076743 [Mycena haematopus]